MKEVLRLSPEKCDLFVKLFSKISQHTPKGAPIFIRNSKIIKGLSSSIVYLDLSTLFEKDDINLDILDHNKAVSLFRTIKTDDDIIIFDDENKNAYFVFYKLVSENNDVYCYFKLEKADEIIDQEEEIPDLSSYKLIDEIDIDKNTFKTIEKVFKITKPDTIEFLIKDNKISGISVPDGITLSFTKENKIDEDEKCLSLKSTDFLIFDGDNINVKIFTNDNNEFLALYTYTISEKGVNVDLKLCEVLADSLDEVEL